MKHVKVISIPEYNVDVVVNHVLSEDAEHLIQISTWLDQKDDTGQDTFLEENREAKSYDIAIQTIKDFSKKSAIAFLIAAADDIGIQLDI